LQDVLRFYESGTVSFDTAETLEIMAVREKALAALSTPGEWVEI
jgi:hypothetical protein